ncbi:ROK family glucokinase [Alkalicoccobacillus porphyridii]|uniref:Glucokinase n=1 Tax=Alkalicoccobacillus porphyridii TaxID=2597270 RepID=A0A553ZZ39_9BACI|nr:ROK family glucokinase [Alkalicoccobacillus porphyridii]TSB46707.1 ROK family glucokinase [Alkalicoccobacillus porphyridii]
MGEEKWLVGIDIGGTTIKLAFITESGEIISKWEIDTSKDGSGSSVVNDIGRAVRGNLSELGKQPEIITAVGAGAPGFLEMETGFVYEAINLGWKDFALKDELEQELGVPVAIDNDANIAALGEMWRGAGDGAKDVLFITLGTGVGGGVIANGEILHGSNGMAGELGHITAVPENGWLCNCGKAGCLETVSSATGIVKLAAEIIPSHPESTLKPLLEKEQLTAKDVFVAAEKEDRAALAVVEKSMYYLGFALANLANTLNPSKIVIGGGVSKGGQTLLKPLIDVYAKFALKRVYEAADIKIAQLGNDAGIVGAAWIALEAKRKA